MKNSKFFNLNYQDFIKGLLMTMIGAALGIIAPSIESGQWVIDWTNIWHTAVAAGVAYIIKNLFTNSQDKFLNKE